VLRTARAMGLRGVAVHSEADAGTPHVRMADAAVRIGPPAPAESYLRGDAIIAAARATGAGAIHPGYGFLSEDPAFAEAVEAAGIAFCGPTPDQIRAFGRKDSARRLARECGLPLLPGTDPLPDAVAALEAAQGIGYPVILKSTAGGGGIGMAICEGPGELRDAFARVTHLAQSSFGSAEVYLERYVARARHVEVQVFGDGRGRVVALGERDCSLQRRNQKVLEETPAPGLDDATRKGLAASAVRLCEAVAYRSAGTVEFLVDAETHEAFFLEVNTRLQVEHGVTEAVFGVDLVEWMLRLAAGEDVLAGWDGRAPRGHAIEARVYAEDPARGYRPSVGTLTHVAFPAGVRVDTWVESGTEVSPYYDPLLAKIVVHGEDQPAALRAMRDALDATELWGLETNLGLLSAAVTAGPFADGRPHTAVLTGAETPSATVEVVTPGLLASLHDHPGRIGYWAVGVPPSGPMDDRSHRLANRVLGNPDDAVVIEMTRIGATLRFMVEAEICLAGADMGATVDGVPVPPLTPVTVPAGGELRMGAVRGPGARAHLAVRGGFGAPVYLGSRSTFALGGFGGHGGRPLRTGDVLRLDPERCGPGASRRPVDPALVPALTSEWEIGVLYGPHAAPDFMTPEYVERLLSADWSVHHNSDRTGVRLVGPEPGWVRPDGGDAGLHPSNIHDTPYAVGAVDFTGDMPVVLGPDGPSLGGFVCPVTVARHELWKLGQLSAGDTVRFRLLDPADARADARRRDREIATLRPAPPRTGPDRVPAHEAVLARRPAAGDAPEVVYRRSGDANLLVEYGPQVLDLELRMRVHALMAALEARAVPGILDLTPGIRSLQIHVDDRRLSVRQALMLAMAAEEGLPPVDHLRVPSRLVHLPLAWEDPDAMLAIERYMRSVRPDAPWCPSNIEFIRRINGLDGVDEVHRIVFEADYLVLGLGDVYLGAPVATPLDPRQRLVTTKYNPARTWTPENAVGIGGAYMCVYGMEGPGGYQLVGRTVPVWNTHRTTPEFAPGTPWLLRFFDRIRFFPVSHAELQEWRRGVRDGTRRLRIDDGVLDIAEHRAFLASIADQAGAFRDRQRAAFAAERERWAAMPPPVKPAQASDTEHEDIDGIRVEAHLAANVWKVLVEPGAEVRAGDVVAVLEAMKMEVEVSAPADGVVAQVRCAPGDLVTPGQPLMVLAEAVPA